jgi:hypothetical protein
MGPYYTYFNSGRCFRSKVSKSVITTQAPTARFILRTSVAGRPAVSDTNTRSPFMAPMMHSPSREDDRRTAGQEIPLILQSPIVHCSQQPVPGPYLQPAESSTHPTRPILILFSHLCLQALRPGPSHLSHACYTPRTE